MIFRLFVVYLLLASPAVVADNTALEAIQEYLDFVEYSEGTISTEQLAELPDNSVFYIDARNAGQFNEGHIPGALNIEWRQILSRRGEIPTDKPVVIYCETGLLSSKAQFILRLAGYSNVKVLWGGYLVWSTKQAFEDAALVKGSPAPNQ